MKNAYEKIVIACSFTGVACLITLIEWQANRKAFDSFMGELHGMFLMAWAGLLILFFTGLILAVATWAVKLNQERKVIRPSKHGPAQVLIHRGEVVLLNQPVEQLDPAKQMAMVKQVMQLSGVLARSAKQLPDDEEYEALPPAPQVQVLEGPKDDHLNLSSDFQPHADVVLAGRGLVVGVSGSGKSNTIAVLSEELGRLKVPTVIFDTENEYQSLCDRRWLPNSHKVSAQDVTCAQAHQFGRYILDQQLQIILDLSSYANDDEAARVMVAVLAGMREWEEELENSLRIPCMTILGEAPVWFPQNMGEIKQRLSEEAIGLMQDAFFSELVRRGRKRGMGLVFDVQRLAEVDKRLLQSNWKILHRQTEDTDLKRYQDMGLSRDEALSLKDGEAFVFTSQVSKFRTRMRLRYTPHQAKTPGLEALRMRQNAGNYAPRNFVESGETSEIYGFSSGDFGAPTEPFRNITDFRYGMPETPRKPQKEVPEELKNSIIRLYAKGMKRVDIQQELSINGDEYWMLRDVCNEYDRQKQEA